MPDTLAAYNEAGICGVVSYGIELATHTTTDVDDPSGREILITCPMSMATVALRGCHPVQNLGATMTYLDRYLWSRAIQLVESDRVDSSEPAKNANNAQEQVGPTPRAKSPAPATKTPPRAPQRQETASEGDVTEWRGWLTEVRMHDSKDSPKYTGKPYILYRVTMNDGKTATTFDETKFTKAQFIATQDDEVIVKVKPNIRKPGTWELRDIERVQTDESKSELELAGSEKNEDPF